MQEIIDYLEKIKPINYSSTNYEHGFFDAIKIAIEKLKSEQVSVERSGKTIE